MTDNRKKPQLPTYAFIIGIIATIWNLMGLMAFVDQITMTPESIAALPEPEQALYSSVPVWVNIAFFLAVFGGTTASILFLMKKRLAYPIFIISFIGIIVQMFNAFFLTNSIEVYGPGGIIMPVLVILVAIYLIWLSKKLITEKYID